MKLDNQKVMTVGESFYCGYSIELKQTGISNTDGFLYRFKPNGQLFVDQMVNNNINEETALKYNYVTEINSEDDIPNFVKKIETDLLSRNKTNKE